MITLLLLLSWLTPERWSLSSQKYHELQRYSKGCQRKGETLFDTKASGLLGTMDKFLLSHPEHSQQHQLQARPSAVPGTCSASSPYSLHRFDSGLQPVLSAVSHRCRHRCTMHTADAHTFHPWPRSGVAPNIIQGRQVDFTKIYPQMTVGCLLGIPTKYQFT